MSFGKQAEVHLTLGNKSGTTAFLRSDAVSVMVTKVTSSTLAPRIVTVAIADERRTIASALARQTATPDFVRTAIVVAMRTTVVSY